MARRERYSDEAAGEDEAELNLTPYLDIMMNLVIFLIFSFQIIIEFRLIDVIPPSISSVQPGDNTQEDPKPTITLVITKDDYKLLSSKPETMSAVTIQNKNGKHDVKELHDHLVSWKKEFDLGTSIVFTADLDTQYDVVVAAMDAIRNDGDALLFPDVLLARPGGVAR